MITAAKRGLGGESEGRYHRRGAAVGQEEGQEASEGGRGKG